MRNCYVRLVGVNPRHELWCIAWSDDHLKSLPTSNMARIAFNEYLNTIAFRDVWRNLKQGYSFKKCFLLILSCQMKCSRIFEIVIGMVTVVFHVHSVLLWLYATWKILTYIKICYIEQFQLLRLYLIFDMHTQWNYSRKPKKYQKSTEGFAFIFSYVIAMVVAGVL